MTRTATFALTDTPRHSRPRRVTRSTLHRHLRRLWRFAGRLSCLLPGMRTWCSPADLLACRDERRLLVGGRIVILPQRRPSR